MSQSIITLKNLTKDYGGKVVVNNIDLDVKKGQFVTFLGPSGCGKTTTLRMIAGFEKPSAGEVLFDGVNIIDLPPHKRNVNTVFQKYALFPHLNVFKNIAFGLNLKRIETEVTDKNGKTKIKKVKYSKKEIQQKVKRALKIVGLSDYEHRDVASLSGGQQQRVAIARAIINEPDVLLLDEPLGALDLKMRQEMQLELKQMHKQLGITFIYVTHDQEEALTMSDTIVVMRDGLICQVGTPMDIYNEPANAFVADFIGESNIFDGIMLEDRKVSFCGNIFKCVDEGFQNNQPVDVVIRPEDFEIRPAGECQISGTITSVIFKGVHYEMTLRSNGFEFLIHNTNECKVGEEVSLYIKPSYIHIMQKDSVTNELPVEFKSNTELVYCGAKFEFNPEVLVAGSRYDAENDVLTTPDGELSLAGKTAVVSVEFTAVGLEDDEEDAPIAGNIYSMIYKGKNYLVTVTIDSLNQVVADTQYLWDAGDRVGITIQKDNFRLVRWTDEEA